MSKNKVRVRDTTDLLDEIELYTQTYKATQIKFVDPTWCTPYKSAIEFCENKIKRNINIKWEAMVHASFLTYDLMKLMKESNCIQMNVGCESGSQKILNDIKKKTTVKKIEKVFDWGKKLNINMRSFFILGMPNETVETIQETEDLMERIDPDVWGCTILCPYPGTEYYSDEFKNVNWSLADEYLNFFWKSKYLSNSELREWQKYLTEKYSDKVNKHQLEIMGKFNEPNCN